MSNNLNQQNHDDTSNTSTNADQSNTSNSSSSKIINGNEYKEEQQIVHRKKIPQTPFEIVGSEELGWILTMGKFRLTDPMKTEEEVVNHLNDESWNVMVKIMYSTYQAIKETERAEIAIKELQNKPDQARQ